MEKAWLAEQVRLGRADKDIAVEVGMTTTKVGYWRRKFEIPPRPASARIKAMLRERYPDGRRGSAAANWRGGRAVSGSGYIRLYMPDHPQANPHGYVYEHRYVMEQKIGRLLDPKEVVDHIDRNRSNNAVDNLRLHASRSQHVKDHFSARDQLMVAEARIVALEQRVEELEYALRHRDDGDA